MICAPDAPLTLEPARMRIALTRANGLVGNALSACLQEHVHFVVAALRWPRAFTRAGRHLRSDGGLRSVGSGRVSRASVRSNVAALLTGLLCSIPWPVGAVPGNRRRLLVLCNLHHLILRCAGLSAEAQHATGAVSGHAT